MAPWLISSPGCRPNLAACLTSRTTPSVTLSPERTDAEPGTLKGSVEFLPGRHTAQAGSLNRLDVYSESRSACHFKWSSMKLEMKKYE